MENKELKTNLVYKKLIYHFLKMKNLKIKDFFNKNINRFNDFSILFNNKILIDFSKNLINNETLKLLLQLSNKLNLKEIINNLFYYKNENKFKKCFFSYPLLRFNNYENNNFNYNNIFLKKNKNFLEEIEYFSEKIISKEWLGYTGKPILNIVNINSYNSNIKLSSIINALKLYRINKFSFYFMHKLNNFYFNKIIKNLNLETTLFIISDISFYKKNLINFIYEIKNIFFKNVDISKYINNHFIIITSEPNYYLKLNIYNKNLLKIEKNFIEEYIIWSYFGLSISLNIGIYNFKKFFNGAYDMDEHFRCSDLNKNIPVILALISIWYSNFFNFENEALVSFNNQLYELSNYYQNLSLQLNIKKKNNNKNIIKYKSKIVYKLLNTNINSYIYNLIYNENIKIPCDFIGVCKNNYFSLNNDFKMSFFFSQTKYLAFGSFDKKTYKNNIYLENKPSNSILLNILDPYNLGSLISLYEHKIFVQSILFNINIFNKSNLFLIKNINRAILYELKSEEQVCNYDCSTNNLINFYKTNRYI